MANLAPCFLSPVVLFFWMSGLRRSRVCCHLLCSMRAMLCWMMRVCVSEERAFLGDGAGVCALVCAKLPSVIRVKMMRGVEILLMFLRGLMCWFIRCSMGKN